MKRFLAIVILVTPLISFSADKEYFDYNCDGHLDFRIWRESNGRLGYYDIYLNSSPEKGYIKHLALSSLYNPVPNEIRKEIECVFPGGHSGKIYNKEVYEWSGDELVLKYVEKQTDVSVSDKIHYIRVVSSILNGKPYVESIELVE